MPRPNKGIRLERNSFGIIEMRWSENGRSKRSSTGSRDMEEAEKVRANFVLLEEREARRVAADAPMMVADAIGDPDEPGEDYWTEHVEPNVVDKETAKYARTKLIEHFGHLAVRDIMPADVADYVLARSIGAGKVAQGKDGAQVKGIGKPSQGPTIRRELGVLNAAINHQVKLKRMPKADQPFIQLPAKSEPRERWLREVEADALLEEARKPQNTPKDKVATARLPRVYLFVALALNTASRKTALLEMKWSQIDLAHGIIYLNPEGRRQTRKRRATVPISSELMPILKRAWHEAKGNRPDEEVMASNVIYGGGSIRKAFTRAVERAGLGKDVTPHTLRHTWGTWAAQAGKSMFDIAGVMGDSVETVTRNYAHHHPDYLRAAVDDVRPSQRSKPTLRVVA